MMNENKDLGRSGADAPSGCQPTASAATASSQSGIPNAGDWLVYRIWDMSLGIARADKITAKLIKVSSATRWDRQIRRDQVLTSFRDRANAENLRDAIAGARGEYNRRLRAAQDECNKRERAARQAYEKKEADLIAEAAPASAMSAGTAETQSGSGLQPASAAPEGGDAQTTPPQSGTGQ